MTEDELLENAAKAVGLFDEWPAPDFEVQWNGHGLWCSGMGRGVLWNPLDDDGDALRLAVKLQLTVCNEHVSAGVAYCTKGFDEATYPEVRSGRNEGEVIADDYAATRRAIVLAAAELAGTKLLEAAPDDARKA